MPQEPHNKKKSQLNSPLESISQNKLITFSILIVIIFYFYLFYIAFESEQSLVPLTMIALVLGLIYQSFKITKSTKRIIIYLVISAFFSLFAFFPNENETTYIFTDHLASWVYCFLIGFLLIMSVEHEKQITMPFGEGLSLLFCLAFSYWLFEKYLLNFEFILTQVLSVIVLLVTAFSILHALFKIKHNQFSRFILSISTCVAIVVLSLDNLFQLMHQGDLSLNKTWTANFILLIQYFLLGISALFLFQNMMLLLQYLPNKYTHSYFSDIKENTQTHIKRFSEDQISWIEGVLCLGISVFVYTLNYYLRIIPPNMCIWLVIFLCPLLIQYLFAQPIQEMHQSQPQPKTHSTNPNKRRQKRKEKL